MKNLLIAAFLMVAAASSNAGNAVDYSRAGGDFTVYRSYTEYLKKVVYSPGLLKKQWDDMRKYVPSACILDKKEIFFECQGIVGLSKVGISSGPLGLMEFELDDPATCKGIRDVIDEHYGKGVIKNSDPCDVHWNLGRTYRGVYIRLAPKNTLANGYYLQFGTERGP